MIRQLTHSFRKILHGLTVEQLVNAWRWMFKVVLLWYLVSERPNVITQVELCNGGLDRKWWQRPFTKLVILKKHFLSIQMDANHVFGYSKMIFRIICVRSIALTLSLQGLVFDNKIPRVTFTQRVRPLNFSSEKCGYRPAQIIHYVIRFDSWNYARIVINNTPYPQNEP